MLRAIGDVSGNIFSYISPLGLILRTAPYSNNNPWPILVIFALSIITGLGALYLNSVRDLGSGVASSKPGRKEASKFLQSTTGLTLRLLRPMIIGWGIALFLLGAAFGSVFGDITTFLEGHEFLQQFFLQEGVTYTIEEQFLTFLIAICSVILTIPPLIAIIKVYVEEKRGRLDNILSKKVSRNKILGNYLFVSIISSISSVLLYTFGIWLSSLFVMSEPLALSTVILSGLVYLPGIWLMVCIALVLIAFIPKMVSLIWIYLGASFILIYLGEILRIPEWVEKLTPFEHIPMYPVEGFSIVPLVVMMLLSAIMCIIGFYGYNKRDI